MRRASKPKAWGTDAAFFEILSSSVKSGAFFRKVPLGATLRKWDLNPFYKDYVCPFSKHFLIETFKSLNTKRMGQKSSTTLISKLGFFIEIAYDDDHHHFNSHAH